MSILNYSFIIPVYNRPEEVDELLYSFTELDGDIDFEVVIIEDGSTISSKKTVERYQDCLNISYFFKPNSGPGDSRNFGMARAKGNYFIILDSDVILPKDYINNVNDILTRSFVHCFGGPDKAHASFSNLQKAIDYSMTSFLTTGGIRGSRKASKNFQPRSFNMGLSKDAFLATKGFGKIHPGEDPDLVLRLWEKGYDTSYIDKAFVYHKRRISWRKFYNQVNKFGKVRPILNKWYPSSRKITYWFPTLFVVFFLMALVLAIFNHYQLLLLIGFYLLLVFIGALVSSKSLGVSLMSMIAVIVQFYGYGTGFLFSTLKLLFSNKDAKTIFPNLFFK